MRRKRKTALQSRLCVHILLPFSTRSFWNDGEGGMEKSLIAQAAGSCDGFSVLSFFEGIFPVVCYKRCSGKKEKALIYTVC